MSHGSGTYLDLQENWYQLQHSVKGTVDACEIWHGRWGDCRENNGLARRRTICM